MALPGSQLQRRAARRVSALAPAIGLLGACCPYVVSEYDGGSTGGGVTTGSASGGTGTIGTSTSSACIVSGPDISQGQGVMFCMAFDSCVQFGYSLPDSGIGFCEGAICPPCQQSDGPRLGEGVCECSHGAEEYLVCLVDAGSPLSPACAGAVASLAERVLDAGPTR